MPASAYADPVGETLLGTGVLLLLGEEVPDMWRLGEEEKAVMTPRQRADRAAQERGELAIVCWHVFAIVDDDGRRFRLGGSFGGHYPIKLNEDPTNTLLKVVRAARDSGNLENLLYDLRLPGMNVTDFEFFAASFRIELSARLSGALRGTWREREPGNQFVITEDDLPPSARPSGI
jgi:hypothetical protein